jgi:sugar lactone lactonase YvrE
MRTLVTLLFLLLTITGYFLLWPVPIEPMAWKSPSDTGFKGDFAQNHRLAGVELISLPGAGGPEDLAVDKQGRVYCAVIDGSILRLSKQGRFEVWANTGGRPLGIEFDQSGNLIVADAFKGLLSVDRNAKVNVLTNYVGESPIRYANDVDIAPDGKIYFSDASTKFAAEKYGGTYPASLLDLMEHGSHGRVLVYDPVSKSTNTVAAGLNFANGVAVSEKGEYLMVNETGHYRVLRIQLTSADYGKVSVVIDNLPGFPDNISRDSSISRDEQASGGSTIFWLGLVSPRNALIDALSDRPFVRKIAQRLPASLRPKAQKYGHVIAISDTGEVVHSLQDPEGGYAYNTGALASGEYLYLSSLHEKHLGRITKAKAGVF